MNSGNYYRIAMKHMKNNNNEKAVCYFQKAVDSCSVEKDKIILERILHYLGISLKKAGYPNRALKSWYLGSLLVKKGRSHDLYNHNVNDYGFHKNESELLDDWQAFYAIQLKKYMLTKSHGRKFSSPEFDMITDLIISYWEHLKVENDMAALCSWDKLNLFSRTRIVFPVMRVNGGELVNIIPFRVFAEKRLEEEYCVISTQKRPMNLMNDFLSVLL